MRNYEVMYGTIPTKNIEINKAELAQRLNVGRDFEHSVINWCINEFEKVVEYKYVYTYVPVKTEGDNICNLGFMKVESKNLSEILKGCNMAVVFAVTTGIGVDRLLNKFSIASQSRHFITDAIGSAAAESLCDYIDDMLRKGNKPHRFSPGYGDLSLDVQPKILDLLCAGKNVGITLNKSLLMTPVKSITAIMGVCNEKNT
ncbi:MAG: vitamin B12 dependent-methionine synthase activation domain-containing protein [Clostridia bacterium]|nr:vitamin B12 dependent-methionine synthase activation domain-containing protein [Clostridia bacterium]